MQTRTHTNGAARPPVISMSNGRSRPKAHAKPAEPVVDTSDHTADRIRAFMDSLQPLEDISVDRSYQDGAAALQRIAASAPADDPTGIPTATLSGKEVASVLAFLRMSEPRNPTGWWNEPDRGPSHMVGRDLVFSCLEENAQRLTDAPSCPVLPAALDAHLSRQQDLAARLAELLDLLRDDADGATGRKGALGIAQELAEGISDALDAVVVKRVAQEVATES